MIISQEAKEKMYIIATSEYGQYCRAGMALRAVATLDQPKNAAALKLSRSPHLSARAKVARENCFSQRPETKSSPPICSRLAWVPPFNQLAEF